MILLANLLYGLSAVIGIIIQFYMWIVIIRAILSWVNPDPYNPIVRFLADCTDPLIYWLRRRLPRTGQIDLAPLLLICGLLFLNYVVAQSLHDYALYLHQIATGRVGI